MHVPHFDLCGILLHTTARPGSRVADKILSIGPTFGAITEVDGSRRRTKALCIDGFKPARPFNNFWIRSQETELNTRRTGMEVVGDLRHVRREIHLQPNMVVIAYGRPNGL